MKFKLTTRPLNKLIIFPIALTALAACTHNLTRNAEGIAASEKAPANTIKEAARSPSGKPLREMNTEYFHGSQKEEEAEFARYVAQIKDIIKLQATNHKQPVQRGFHAKNHACLWGYLHLDPVRDSRTRRGIFSGAGAQDDLPVWGRFSNGVGWAQSDVIPDVRGLALKVMGVDGPRLNDDEKATQDFLMTNSPTPIGNDAADFMKFAHGNAKGPIRGLIAGSTHHGFVSLARTVLVPSTPLIQYWSGSPYHLGADQAVKFTVKPEVCTMSAGLDAPTVKTEKHLASRLKETVTEAAKTGICFGFYVQFQADPYKTPIEEASVEWSEKDAPLVYVGHIDFPPQTYHSSKANDYAEDKFCDGLSFNPWHGIVDHQPMGHMNRARRAVYKASSEFRSSLPEPTDFHGFDKN